MPSWNYLALLILHPARVSLALFAVGLLLYLTLARLVRGGLPRVHEIYRQQFAHPHRERQLVAALGFYFSFALVRLLTHSIRAGRGPFHNVEMGGRHIHHLVWGILLLRSAPPQAPQAPQ